GLEWSQEHPNQLRFTRLGERPQILSRGSGGLTAAAGRATRVPPGHPEGYLEAFANLYTDLAEQIEAKRHNRRPDPLSLSVPSVEDGARGVKFILAALESSARGGAWVDATVAL
ncbi:MAG TPA: gfo/Idh/MocA family oxidoreductase, partial [Methylomirabilota bacterium]|nr:gfo/Idh/MocA family oxidoreductase [Methylomirabilota bacterium]